MIRPYPPEWHRRLDFLPPLGLRIALNEGKLELYSCRTAVSILEEKRLPAQTDTEFGSLKVNPVLRNVVNYEMGSPDPTMGISPVSQKEILDDITDHIGGAVRMIGEIPDVVIKTRGVVEKMPREAVAYCLCQPALRPR